MNALVPLALACLPALQEDPIVQLEPTSVDADEVVYEAELGKLRVPANRRRAESGTLELAFLRLLSTADEPGPPLFFLPGGPGNPATPMAASPVWRSFLELGDVVLLDPRGVADSEPELSWGEGEVRPARFFGNRDEAMAYMAEVAARARQALAGRGVDLAGLSTLELADDVDALRRALGYERVNLMGHSYGTLLGLEILRRHPGTVARFASAGTAAPGDMQKLPGELDASLRTLAGLVAADPRIGADMPDLFADFAAVVEDLTADPLPVPLRDRRTGATREVLLGGFGIQLLAVADLADTSDLPVFPRLVRSLQDRDPSVVSWFLEKRLRQFAGPPWMMLAVRAAQGATAERWEEIRAQAEASPFGLARCLFSPECDEVLGVADVGDAARAPVESDVPTLLISGTLDAATPPAQAERVRAGLSRSGHVVVEYAGHEDLLPDPRIQERIVAFLAGAEPEDELLEGEPPRFAPLAGDAGGVRHPALGADR